MEQDRHFSELDGHVITDIKFKQFRARYPRLHGKNARLGIHGFGGTVKLAQIFTDQGASGWGAYEGECAPCEMLIGKRVSEVFRSDYGILDSDYKAYDIALHDLAGNILGIPVYRMIREDAEGRANVYDGAIYMNDLIPEDNSAGVETILNDCQYDYDLGYRTFKIKIGRSYQWMEHEEGLNRDIEVVKKIHERFPTVRLMVDANDGYTYEDCIRFLEGIGDCPLVWFEEPFREAKEPCTRLKEYFKYNRPTTWLADGESYTDIGLLHQLSEEGCLDVWQPDILSYGFTAWRNLLKDITAKGYLASPHSWGLVVKTCYCAHLAAAYPHHIPCVEAVLGESEGVDYSNYQLREGVLMLPQDSGFGIRLIWAEECQTI